MKILIIPNNTDSNCYGVRNALPAEFLKKRGHEVRIQNTFESYFNERQKIRAINPEMFEWADTIIFNRHYELDNETIYNIIEYSKSIGKKVIYETDDLLTGLDSTNPMYQEIKKHYTQVGMMVKHADIVTTTGQGLKDELSKLNPSVKILPNCIDPSKWRKRKKGNKKVKVGWAGGISHAKDLMLIVDVIKELQEELDFTFTIFGLSPLPWSEYIIHLQEQHLKQIKDKPEAKPADWFKQIMELNERLIDLKWTHQPFVPLSEYNETLAKMNFDIGLCPLVDNKFNRCKSAIKFYEYAMVNTMTLASKVTPYKEEVNTCAKNQHGKWKAKLKKFIEDKKVREFITDEQREWVLKNRDINSNIHLWERCYSRLV